MAESMTNQEKIRALGEVLYERTHCDWDIRVSASLTEPTCPTVMIAPEGFPSSRYRSDRSTIEEAMTVSIDMAYREWVLGERVGRDVPWTDSHDPILHLLERGPAALPDLYAFEEAEKKRVADREARYAAMAERPLPEPPRAGEGEL